MADCSLNDYVEIDGKRMRLVDLVVYYLHFSYASYTQQLLGKPLFWIGMYIVLASLVCTLAMAADLVQGLRHRKLWFPCKIFTLNAASLTLLAVAMKLPVDLTTPMGDTIDQTAKFTSMSFMCAVMGNFMPSLGSMTNKELLANLKALGIMVITMVANVCIQFFTGAIYFLKIQNTLAMFSMVLLFVLMSFSALAVPTFRKIIDVKYREKHKMASNQDTERTDEKFAIGRLKQNVNKYWMMAETGAPQFVMASSVTCSTSGAICFLNALNLAVCWFQTWHWSVAYMHSFPTSDYEYTTKLIAWIQTVGVVVGTIGPAFRWLTTINLEGSKKGINNYKNAFKTENYWIKRLVEWKESPVRLQIRARKYRKIVQGTKVLILYICIKVQIAIVVASKLVRLIPMCFVSKVVSCFCCSKCLKEKPFSNPESRTELDSSSYVLQVEGEYELPKRILKNMLNAVDELVRTAKKRQPKNLMELLEKCAGFKGVAEVDSEQVPRLLSDEPPKCWSLLVVTLTSIAISLPNIRNEIVDRLLCSVSEGLLYVRDIERNLHNKEDLVNTEKAADLVWSRVEFYHEWLGEDLHKLAIEGKTPKENLQKLADLAKNVVIEFQRNMTGGKHEDFLNWPVKVIAAHSMYQISQTIMLKYQADDNKTCEDLFEQLSVMIADIMGACLTNIPQAVSMKCYCSAIEKREGSVKEAARLLGETEEILNFLQQHELPSQDLDQAAYLDEWVAKIKQGVAPPLVSSSKGEIVASCPWSGELHLAVE